MRYAQKMVCLLVLVLAASFGIGGCVLLYSDFAVQRSRAAASDAAAHAQACTLLQTEIIDLQRRGVSIGDAALTARVEAQRVMKALAPALAEELPVIGLEPSCLLALRDEFYSLSLGPAVGQLGKQAFLLEEFLMREGNKGLKLDLKPLPAGKAVVHGHCHQKAFGTMKAMKKVLGWIPEFDFEIVDASCCGMSGSFGMESEHYKLSQAMGELALLPAVRGAGPDAAVIANGFSCRHQIHDGTGRQAEHIALLLARALK